MRRCLLVFLLSAPLAGFAHDLWLEKDTSQAAGGYVLFQGHRYSGHAGGAVVPYDPAAVKAATCLETHGAARPLALGKVYPVRLGERLGDCAAVLVSFSTGYWTKTAWETKNVPKTGVAGVMKSWLSEETVKRIDRWVPAAAQPLGAGLEITPVGDPLKLAPDDKLVVLVTENKKPRAGVPVAYQGNTRGVSGEDGRIAIRIRQGGVQIISASIEAPLNDGRADSVIRATELQFELGK